MSKLKLTILTLLILALGTVVSACVKKSINNTNSANDNANVANINTATTTEEIDTSNWKTYRNEEYGFEFKYPGEWVIEEKNSDILFWRNIEKNQEINYEIGAPLVLNIKKIDSRSIKDWFNKEFSNRDKNFFPDYIETTIGKANSLEILDPLNIGGCDQRFVLIKKSYLHEIKRHGSTCDYSNELFNEILASFIFID